MAMVAMNQYSSSHSESKAKRWLHSFSQRVTFYGGYLDVFVQHHPEYVALAWGAMKLLFSSVMNHEKTIRKLAKGLSLIADRLPRAEILAALYPKREMQRAIEELNAHVLRFLVRAYDWCNERPWEHLLHSITRPPELRYDDLLEDIECSTRNIKDLASCGGHVKIHEMQKQFDQMATNVVAELKKVEANITTAVNLHSSAMISTNYKLTDLQFSQIMGSISVTGILAPDKVSQYYIHLQASRPRVTQAAGPTLSPRFTKSPKLRMWDDCDSSAITIVRAKLRCQQAIRTFCWDLVQQLRGLKIRVLFAIKIPLQDSDSSLVDCQGILKYLIQQALQINQTLQTEGSMSLTCTQFHSATSADELFQALEAVLSCIQGSCYILIDLDLLSRELTGPGGFSWLRAFLGFFDRLAKRNPTHKVKVMLLTSTGKEKRGEHETERKVQIKDKIIE